MYWIFNVNILSYRCILWKIILDVFPCGRTVWSLALKGVKNIWEVRKFLHRWYWIIYLVSAKIGQNCWSACGKGGDCPGFCGANAACCKRGFDDPGCIDGCDEMHCCTLKGELILDPGHTFFFRNRSILSYTIDPLT